MIRRVVTVIAGVVIGLVMFYKVLVRIARSINGVEDRLIEIRGELLETKNQHR